MESWTSTCPRCGAGKLTAVQLPRPHGPSEQPSTRRALRCLACDAQWADEEQWQELRGGR